MNVRTFLFVGLGLMIACTTYSQTRKLKKIQRIIDQSTSKKLPGVTVYVRWPEDGEHILVSGFADTEHKIPLQKDDIFAIGSIGKMYNAVAALKLIEAGRFRLDDKIKQYLPEEVIANLPNGELITIRHLLGNTSGIFNYEFDPELNRLYLSGKLKLDTLTHLNTLRRYVFGKPADCLPGAEYHYSSTNFMLLAMIMDTVTPTGHTDYLQQEVLVSNGFLKTYYRTTPPSHFVHHYGDLNGDGMIDDVTAQTIETTNWFIGDDGIYAPIGDAAHFLEALVQGNLLEKVSFIQMTTWNNPKKPDYGLGLMADKSFPYKFLMGHSGRGIGMTTDLFYFPKQQMTVGIFCNVGLRGTKPEIKKQYLRMRKKIVKKLFLF